jgi:DNA-binding transcriptional regulator YiaG
MDEGKAELQRHFAGRFSALRRRCPQAYWAERYGLSLGAVQDLEQGRVLPSRAMVLLMHAIAMQPEFMERAAKEAADDLARLSAVRGVRN